MLSCFLAQAVSGHFASPLPCLKHSHVSKETWFLLQRTYKNQSLHELIAAWLLYNSCSFYGQRSEDINMKAHTQAHIHNTFIHAETNVHVSDISYLKTASLFPHLALSQTIFISPTVKPRSQDCHSARQFQIYHLHHHKLL